MSSFVVNNEVDEKACLGCGRLLSEASIASEDGALLFAMSGKQLHQFPDIFICAGGPQPFLRPVKCIPHAPIVTDLLVEHRAERPN